MKPQDLKDIILHNIRFKPAKAIIQVLLAGNEILSKNGENKIMSISAEEATYCIFNDIRFTSGKIKPHKVAQTIIYNRKNHINYYNIHDQKIKSLRGKPRSKGDVTRYAGDILYYMEIANLLDDHHGYFYLKGNEQQAITLFSQDKTFFNGYEQFYGVTNVEISALSKVEPMLFEYVNQSLNPELFKTDIRSILGDTAEVDVIFGDRIKEVVQGDGTSKDIGNLGEAIVCGHEKMRLKIAGYDDFVRLVQIVDTPAYHPGFDIDSYEGDGTEDHRYIEVKTTISKKAIQMYGFHMSPNEWRVANTIRKHYCVYRLMLSESKRVLLILRDPVNLYKKDIIEALPRDGMEISFDSETFKPTEILTWQ